MFWTFQPKREQSLYKHIPFITWPIQDVAIDRIIYGIRFGGDLLIDKSREMGATWIILGAFVAEWLLMPDTTLLAISRKEEYVWQGHKGGKGGNKDTLFWKIFYLWQNLPHWIKPRQDEVFISERHFENLRNDSTIDGESTNADVGAGGRRQAVMCDEFARVKYADADSIQETLSDTTPCRIFNSTPTSRGHPFGQIRFAGKVPVVTLAWYDHPWKIQGWYESPKYNVVVIKDMHYYMQQWPHVFEGIAENQEFNYSDLEKTMLMKYPEDETLANLNFVADGGDRANEEMFSPTGKRSPWYDRECRRRTLRDKAVNIDINYAGAGDVVFNSTVLARQIDKFAKEPAYRGEISFDLEENTISNVKFTPNFGKRRLKLWCDLYGSRPDQTHNYIMGEDISMGTGQSNSVISVFDVDVGCKVASWACSNTGIIEFAEMTYAVGAWFGGVTLLPFNIWEANGPGGIFGRRLTELGYDLVFRTREEKTPSRKRKKSLGWYSTGDNKLNMIVGYDAALAAAFHPELKHKAFYNPHEESLREAEDYVFYPSGKAIGPSRSEADEGGAKAAHGDHVIADALCQLARHDQPRAALELPSMNNGTLASRRVQYLNNSKRVKDNDLWLI